MKTAKIFFLILFLIPFLSQAGDIYGTLKGDDGKPLVSQVVQIMQNDKFVASDTTDTNGYFSVTIKEVGKFKLEVTGFKGTSLDVFSTNKSTRYNLILNKSGDKWLLKNL